MSRGVDDAVWELVRRYGRTGINEAVVWTMLRSGESPPSTVEVAQAVERLIAAGRLYRHHRRTRTMLKAAAEVTPAVAALPDLFGSTT